jgi:hypothetical protein
VAEDSLLERVIAAAEERYLSQNTLTAYRRTWSKLIAWSASFPSVHKAGDSKPYFGEDLLLCRGGFSNAGVVRTGRPCAWQNRWHQQDRLNWGELHLAVQFGGNGHLPAFGNGRVLHL